MGTFDIGMIGLAVMGRSLALNMADKGFRVAGYNRSREVTEAMVKEYPHDNFTPFDVHTIFSIFKSAAI